MMRPTLLAANLEAHGIKCWVDSDDCAGWYTNLTAPGGVRLSVCASDAEAAIALLDAQAPFAELNQIEAEAVASSPLEPAPLKKLAMGQIVSGIVFGIVAGILLCLLYQWSSKLGTKTFNYTTAEGKDYESFFYRDGHLLKSIRDRNLDGNADQWAYYENGQVVRVEYDENFDGKPDLFVKYSNGLPVTAEGDSDFNGIPDVFFTHQNGMVKQIDYRPNGSKFITAREIFQNGVLTEILRGGDSNGNFKEDVHYDPFFNPMPVDFNPTDTNAPTGFQLLQPASK
jgi:hypothetical protein